MTRETFNQRVRALNENTRFQLIGRVATVVGVPAILGLTAWMLSVNISMSQDVAVMKTKLEAATSDPYKGADAARDFSRRDDAIKFMGIRIEDNSARIRALEALAARR